MIILGIDPGTATTGFGVIRVADDLIGREFDYGQELINYGNISTPKDMPMEHRLMMLHTELNGIMEKYKPDQMVVEMLFFGANTKTAIAVGQARGVILLSAAKYNIPYSEYTGPSVKLMVTGNGRADKKDVHEAVRKWFGENGEKRRALTAPKGGHLDDATDAIAIALCHVLKTAAK